MAEVLVEFDTVLKDSVGGTWAPRACGAATVDGLWEGWIEFLPIDGADGPVHTSRETQQSNHDQIVYWAQGLTQAFLEGALRRALDPHPTPKVLHAVRAAFDTPAHHERVPPRRGSRAILNPFETLAQGEDILLRELGSLGAPRLRDIAHAYELASPSEIDDANREELMTIITRGVVRPQRTGRDDRPDRQPDSHTSTESP